MTTTLEKQLRHNAWANHAVLTAFRQRVSLLEHTDYASESLRERARHLAEVERGFLDVLRDVQRRPDPPAELEELVRYQDETGRDFADLVASWDDAARTRDVFIPWWDQSFAAADNVAQVLYHSAQHRAELAWELARNGISTGELDYIRWLAGGEPAPGEPVPEE